MFDRLPVLLVMITRASRSLRAMICYVQLAVLHAGKQLDLLGCDFLAGLGRRPWSRPHVTGQRGERNCECRGQRSSTECAAS